MKQLLLLFLTTFFVFAAEITDNDTQTDLANTSQTSTKPTEPNTAEDKKLVEVKKPEAITKKEESQASLEEKLKEKSKHEKQVVVHSAKRRFELEKQVWNNDFGLLPHHTNYALPYMYDAQDQKGRDQEEFKLQVSIKKLLASKPFGWNMNLYFGFTHKAWWQIYDSGNSRPFRENNYAPELFADIPIESKKVFGMDFKGYRISGIHESNGGNTEKSRSWNRIYWQGMFEKGAFKFSPKVWYRIPESQKTHANDPEGDDNPDIYKYYGYAEFNFLYFFENDHSVHVMLRNNLQEYNNNKGALEVNWSFPLDKKMYFYVQYFNGYGESLIDYNQDVNKIGFGLMITRWM